MGGESESIHGVQVRTSDEEKTHEVLMSDPALRVFAYYVGDAAGDWIGVYPRLIIRGPKVAKSLSKLLRTHAFAFRIYGGDAFMYEYYRNGELRDRYSSQPEAVRRKTEMDPELEEITAAWESGEVSAQEYRERVEAYLEGFDARAAGAGEAAVRSIRAVGPREAGAAALEAVSDVLRGTNAEKVVRQVLAARFTDPVERAEAEAGLERALAAEGSSGGDPRAYREIFGDEGTVPEMAEILRRGGPGTTVLREMARKLGIPRVECSFQMVRNARVPPNEFTEIFPQEQGE